MIKWCSHVHDCLESCSWVCWSTRISWSTHFGINGGTVVRCQADGPGTDASPDASDCSFECQLLVITWPWRCLTQVHHTASVDLSPILPWPWCPRVVSHFLLQINKSHPLFNPSVPKMLSDLCVIMFWSTAYPLSQFGPCHLYRNLRLSASKICWSSTWINGAGNTHLESSSWEFSGFKRLMLQREWMLAPWHHFPGVMKQPLLCCCDMYFF